MRTVSSKLLLATVAVGLLIGPLGVSTASADEPSYVYLDAYFCSASDGQGTIYDLNAIPANTQILMFSGWGTKTRGQLEGFLNNVTWVMTRDGTQGAYLADTGILNLGVWVEYVFFDGGTLASGQSMTSHFDAIIKSATFDGSGHYQKGSVFDGGVDCTVTAA